MLRKKRKPLNESGDDQREVESSKVLRSEHQQAVQYHLMLII